ncbi:MAG: ABC transporter substrate-binding protein/permease [Myxococcaceae bacterium]|nr:ABC transporter substrate-binding protein/permease [Myxococcaceae bacterium]
MTRALALLLVVASGAASADTLSDVRAAKTLRWGADAQGGAPYVFQDPMDPNRLVGFEVDLAQLLAKKLGVQARPVPGQWDKLLELLARGDFDVAINGLEVAEEKKRVCRLSRPYLEVPERLTIRRGDGQAPRTLEALAQRTVGTLPGSMAARIAERAQAQVKTYLGGQDEIYADLKLGRIDAVLLDAPVARYYGDIDPAFETVDADFGSVRYAVALRSDDEALAQAVDQALGELIADGSLRAIYERWGVWSPQTAALFGDTRPPSTEPAVEFERWRAAVGHLPPFLERVRTRYPQVLPLFLRGAGLTLLVSVCAMVLAIALGVTLAFSRRYGPAPVRWLAAAYIEFFRGTPLLVQLTLVYFGLPELDVRLSPFVAGVVALGLNYAAAEAENYRAGLESVARGQLEAAQVLGLSRWQTLRFVVGPQALRISIPPMTNDFIALLKDSSLVSVVTLTELTTTYTTLANSMRDHLGLGALVALLYLLLGLPFALLAQRVEAYFGRHLKRGEA